MVTSLYFKYQSEISNLALILYILFFLSLNFVSANALATVSEDCLWAAENKYKQELGRCGEQGDCEQSAYYVWESDKKKCDVNAVSFASALMPNPFRSQDARSRGYLIESDDNNRTLSEIEVTAKPINSNLTNAQPSTVSPTNPNAAATTTPKTTTPTSTTSASVRKTTADPNLNTNEEPEKIRICEENKSQLYDSQLSAEYKETTGYASAADANLRDCVSSSLDMARKFSWQGRVTHELEEDMRYRHQQIARKYARALDKCEKEHNVAIECCGSPEKCFAKPDGVADENSNSSQYADIVKLFAGTALNFPTSSVASMCDKMKTVSLASAGINAYLGGRCTYFVGQCKNTCGKTIKEIESGSLCKNGDCSDLLAKFDAHTYDCQIADNASAKMAAQSIAATTASKMADLCKKAATADNNSNATGNDQFANANCTTPAAASNPICQAQCARAGAGQNQNCLGYPGPALISPGEGRGDNLGSGGGETAGNSTSHTFGNLVDEVEAAQDVVPVDIAAVQGRSSAGGTGGGGSGASMGGSSSASGGNTSGVTGGNSTRAQGSGYDTGILKGTISGGGYSPNAYMRTGSGSGFASYGRSSAITASARPFNLNDYLPRDKAKRKLAIRRLASLASARVSPSQIDIFKKVTNRYYQLCLRDALYDCASLRKMKSVNKN